MTRSRFLLACEEFWYQKYGSVWNQADVCYEDIIDAIVALGITNVGIK
jgi:hypothetical protein